MSSGKSFLCSEPLGYISLESSPVPLVSVSLSASEGTELGCVLCKEYLNRTTYVFHFLCRFRFELIAWDECVHVCFERVCVCARARACVCLCVFTSLRVCFPFLSVLVQVNRLGSPIVSEFVHAV